MEHEHETELFIEITSYQPGTPATAFDPGEDEEFTFKAYLFGFEIDMSYQSEEVKDAIHDYALEIARQEHEEARTEWAIDKYLAKMGDYL